MAFFRSILAKRSPITNAFTNTIWHRQMSGGNPVECKVAVITGGAIGIGVACAKSLLENGARGVMLGDIREKEGKELAAELNKTYGKDKALFMKCDVTKKDEFENLFKCTYQRFPSMDIVINNAGLLQDKYWPLELAVNVNGLVQGTLFGFHYMGKHGKHEKGRGGVIVNMASIYGLQQAYACPVYNGTKGFVIRFSNAMSHEYYEKMTGVKVLTMCPGVTDTNMIDESSTYALDGFGDLGKLVSEGLANLPPQPASACGDCLIKMLCSGENGGIWVIEESECYKVRLPDRQTLRVCD
ncbi:alcohol dehydrogenase-like [Tribolium castaneum]|uniref:alcohol dehydrogenase-like n=1 Tax=Tribolium castaneum TaxID=7070 RepID=UPI0030FF2D52